jgi:myo-inositol-1(or 4)-monophosphatase
MAPVKCNLPKEAERMEEHQAPSLAFLIHMTQKASRAAADIFAQPALLDTEWKADDTPVTAGDRAVHTAIVDILSVEYPQISIVGEEGTHGTRVGPDHEYWLSVDEIDGTTAFTYGIPVFTTMVALMRGNEVMKSVIHDPTMQRTYSAERGRGAFLNDIPIRARGQKPKSPHISIAAWPALGRNDMLVPRMISGVARELHDRNYRLTTAWSIGHSDALVAAGVLVGSLFPGSAVHDTVAADLIVREAGGVATDLWGKPLSYGEPTVNGHIFACNQETHDDLVEIVRRHDNRQR